jgi:hypothetical protein
MRPSRWSLLLLVWLSGACASTIGPTTPPVEALVVLDSLDDTLRIVPVDSANIVHRVPLGLGDAVANTLALNGQTAAIGISERGNVALDNVVLFDIGAQHQLCGGPIPLHGGAAIGALVYGPAGEVYAATPSTDSIAVVFPSCGVTQGSIAGGPRNFGVARGVVYAVVANRETCLPRALDCPSWLVPLPERVNDSIPLLGPGGASGAVFGPDGFLYVINAGTGASDGVLSKVDPSSGSAVAIPGFGHLPQYIATDASSRIFVVSATDGLMVYNVRTQQVERGAGNGVPVGAPRGIAIDDLGHIYIPQASTCSSGSHGTILVLGSDLVARPPITVGRCPVAVDVTDISAAAYHFN